MHDSADSYYAGLHGMTASTLLQIVGLFIHLGIFCLSNGTFSLWIIYVKIYNSVFNIVVFEECLDLI